MTRGSTFLGTLGVQLAIDVYRAGMEQGDRGHLKKTLDQNWISNGGKCVVSLHFGLSRSKRCDNALELP